MGGMTEHPDYDSVCSGRSGHAEVVQVAFDPALIQYPTILDWFWRSHDPTTLNRQGNDVGTQYRSAIFFHSEEQRQQAEESREAYQKRLSSPIVTEIVPAAVFYEAESYHQDFTNRNPSHSYVRHVILPKLSKLGL
jgi:peptide-methionine (S)-S-oxide reductase